MLDLVPAKHLVLHLAVAGDDIDAPAPARDMVQGRTPLGQVQRVQRAVEHMDGRDQHDAPGDRGQRGRGGKRIQRIPVEHPAIAALGQPLRQRKHQIESQVFRLQHQVLVVIKAPVGAARQGRGTPAARLDRQKQAQQNGLRKGLRQGAVRKIQRRGECLSISERIQGYCRVHGAARGFHDIGR